MKILDSALAIKEQILTDRRHIHRNPEVGFDLPETAAYVQKRLKEMGIKSQICGGPLDKKMRENFKFAGFPDMKASTGVVATIGQGEPCILLRADMDALPMNEAEGLVDFTSQKPGFAQMRLTQALRLMLFSKTERTSFAELSSLCFKREKNADVGQGS